MKPKIGERHTGKAARRIGALSAPSSAAIADDINAAPTDQISAPAVRDGTIDEASGTSMAPPASPSPDQKTRASGLVIDRMNPAASSPWGTGRSRLTAGPGAGCLDRAFHAVRRMSTAPSAANPSRKGSELRTCRCLPGRVRPTQPGPATAPKLHQEGCGEAALESTSKGLGVHRTGRRAVREHHPQRREAAQSIFRHCREIRARLAEAPRAPIPP